MRYLFWETPTAVSPYCPQNAEKFQYFIWRLEIAVSINAYQKKLTDALSTIQRISI